MDFLAEENSILTWTMGIMLPLVIAAGIYLMIMYFSTRRKFRQAQQALAEGRLADALTGFKSVAKRQFTAVGKSRAGSSSGPMFEGAMTGLARVYGEAGKDVDLAPILEMRKDIEALRKDKRYWSTFKGTFSSEGQEIHDEIMRRGLAAIGELPGV